MTKTCSRCNTTKEVEQFYKSKKSADGLDAWCILCHSEYGKEFHRKPEQVAKRQTEEFKIKRRFYNKVRNASESGKLYRRKRLLRETWGITVEQYNKILESQNNRCAVCKTDKPNGMGLFHVDHDHKTNVIRGLLCHNCNTGIGLLKDSSDILRAGIEYLEKYNGVDYSEALLYALK